MKKIELLLTDYEFEGRDNDGAPKTMQVVMKEELSTLLRAPGIYDNGVEMCDGVDVAKQIKNCIEDSLELSEQEHALVKKVIDKLMANKNMPLGGVRYETMIERVFKAGEWKPEKAKK